MTPLENHKATHPAFNVRPSSFKWRFHGETIVARFVY